MPFCVLAGKNGGAGRRNQTKTMNAIADMGLSPLIEGITHDPDKMRKARYHAIAFLEKTMIEKPVEFQEQFLKNMNREFFQQLDLQKDSDLAIAVIIGAIEEEAGQRGSRPATTAEIMNHVVSHIVADA